MKSLGFSTGESIVWPQLFIIGAPKCGTTALAHYLAEHPRICFSARKEPHYFATDLEKQRRVATLESYLALFAPRQPSSELLAEASVWYLYSRAAVPNILGVRPDARFIVMLRNPIDAAYALHQQKLRSLDEDVMNFEEAFRLQDERRLGRRIPASCREAVTILYGEVCKFGLQIERLYKIVDRRHVKIILYDDFARDTRSTYRDVLSFAGLVDDGRTKFERINEGSKARYSWVNRISRRPSAVRRHVTRSIAAALGVRCLGVSRFLRKLNTVSAPRSPLKEGLRCELASYFAEDVSLLSGLLGRDLSAWLSSAAGTTWGRRPK